MYQSTACSYSVAASSWNSILLPAIVELGMNPTAHFIPGNGFCFAGLKVLNTPCYLVIPSGLSRRLIYLIKAINERARQCGTILRRQGESFLQ
jgi:hypothetical protein